MCEKCKEFFPLEQEFVNYFKDEMIKWAEEKGLDIIGIRNGLSFMLNSLEDQLMKKALEEQKQFFTSYGDADSIKNVLLKILNGESVATVNSSIEIPESKLMEEIDKISDSDFNSMIFSTKEN